MAEHLIGDWLGIRDEHHARPAEQRRSVLGRAVLEILTRHAPQVAALTPDATWDKQSEASVRRAIGDQFRDDATRRDASNAVAHVIECGKFAGLWGHTPWSQLAIAPLAGSRARRADIPRIRDADRRRHALIEAMPRLLASTDPQVLCGAVLVSAALLSALVLPALLEQLVARPLPLRVRDDVAWIDMRLGTAERPWRAVRRFIPDPVTRQLMAHAIASLDNHAPQSTVHDALDAICHYMKWNPLTLEQLAWSARAWWATRLPSWMVEYNISPPIAPSLPATAWQRLLTGRPLARCEAPAAPDHDSTDINRGTGLGISTTAPASLDGFAQVRAVRALMRTLRVARGEKKLSHRELARRLGAWDALHMSLGGWVALMGAWTRDATIHRPGGAFRRGPGARAPGVLRYLEGFALRLVENFRDFPPQLASEDVDETADRMECLRASLESLNSCSVARTGLVHFLRFVAHSDGPDVHMASEWNIVTSPWEANANILTFCEFDRLRAWLARRVTPDSYPHGRLQMMAVISFRTGLRWEELQTLRLSDVTVADSPAQGSEIWIRATAHAHRKNRQSHRKIPLELFLSATEQHEFHDFVLLATTLHGHSRPGTDYLFADPSAPDLPPAPDGTHDVIQRGMRAVSGDPTVVFHHLRHAAATLTLLRLWTDDNHAALGWITGYRDHVGALDPDEPLACAATGRGVHDASRLYVLSELLGHVDPTTTMRCYVHLADVVVAREVARHLVLPGAIEAAIEGVKTASIRRRRYRDGVQAQTRRR